MGNRVYADTGTIHFDSGTIESRMIVFADDEDQYFDYSDYIPEEPKDIFFWLLDREDKSAVDLIDFIIECEKGITINGEWYDFDVIFDWYKEHAGDTE